MTRRIMAMELPEGTYLVSQEFNGDHQEAKLFGLQELPKTADWNSIADYANCVSGSSDQRRFGIIVRFAEAMFGYEPEPLTVCSSLPSADEVLLYDGVQFYT